MKKIIIFGASGLLGTNASMFFSDNNYEVYSVYFNHRPSISKIKLINIDIQNDDYVFKFLNNVKPNIILNCIGLTNVDECEKNYNKAIKLNAEFPELLAKYTSNTDIKYIHISTDQLWDGKKSFYKEDDIPSPINKYALTKANAEERVFSQNPKSLVIRTNFFGQGTEWRQSFSDWAIQKLKDSEKFYGYDDIFYTPISIPYLLKYLDSLINCQYEGIINIGGIERISKYEFIIKLAKIFNFNFDHILKGSYGNSNQDIQRPKDMSLNVSRLSNLIKDEIPDITSSINSIF